MSCYRQNRENTQRRRRLLLCEPLEPRHLLAADLLNDGLGALDDISFTTDDSTTGDAVSLDSAAIDESLSAYLPAVAALAAPRHNAGLS